MAEVAQVEYRTSPALGNAELNCLFAAAWDGHREREFGPVLSRSLAYLCAFDRERLIGFVNIAWDGGVHAFVLDTTVAPEYRHRRIGTELMRRAAQAAARAGVEWLHVDYEPHLDGFYRACGFRPTAAGLMRLAAKAIIRDATQEDAVALARIHVRARASAMPWLAKVHSHEDTEAWMAEYVLPRQRVRVATVDGVPVGFAAVAPDRLEQLYVDPAHQNAGIGSRLFDEVCSAARRAFRFWVFQRNTAARRFYERHGGRLIELTDGQGNEEREPDALYEQPMPRR